MGTRRKELRVDGIAEPVSHYTDAVQYGSLIFISGCVPLDRNSNVVGDNASDQTRQVLENMGSILRAAGANFQNVLKVTVYRTQIGDRVSINPVRKEFLGEDRPASTLIEVSALALPNIKVEVDAVAGLDE